MPTPSLPPDGRLTFHKMLNERSDGRWYMLRSYPNGDVARQTKYKLSKIRNLPDGRWEFRHGRIPDDPNTWGVWARNLDGPLVGTDEPNAESGITGLPIPEPPPCTPHLTQTQRSHAPER